MKRGTFSLFLNIISLHLERPNCLHLDFWKTEGNGMKSFIPAAPMGSGECFIRRTGWTYKLYETDAFQARIMSGTIIRRMLRAHRVCMGTFCAWICADAALRPIRLDEQAGRTHVLKTLGVPAICAPTTATSSKKSIRTSICFGNKRTASSNTLSLRKRKLIYRTFGCIGPGGTGWS